MQYNFGKKATQTLYGCIKLLRYTYYHINLNLTAKKCIYFIFVTKCNKTIKINFNLVKKYFNKYNV